MAESKVVYKSPPLSLSTCLTKKVQFAHETHAEDETLTLETRKTDEVDDDVAVSSLSNPA